MKHPYQDLNNYQFWRRGVSSVDRHELDPVVNPKFKLNKNEKIATAGSCFAQHISRRLSGIGFNYFVSESGQELSEVEKKERGFGVFSARYGNLYTVRQLVQLFDEALGIKTPEELPWLRADGRYVDPFRPNIEPNGYSNPETVIEERSKHLNYVKDIFLNADVFIFTLGLTESWINKNTGEVFPLAPGVSGGNYNENDYTFKNFTVEEVISDLRLFLTRLRVANPKIKVLLTVSPVPLIATYENKHVIVSTTYSKSVLRVAAETVERENDWVEYFPSYEIITSNFNMGAYFEHDLREVNKLGVSHAMRCFLNNYTDAAQKKIKFEMNLSSNTKSMSDIVCDEESIMNTSK